MKSGIAEGVFPGAVLLVALEGRTLFHQAYGLADLLLGESVTVETLFDLASLTKPLATSLCMMCLVEAGKISLESRLGDLLSPMAETEKAEVTVEQLLRHTSGLPDYRPYYEELVGRPPLARTAQLRKLLTEEGLITPAGKKTRYSDIGFLILQWILEKISGRSLAILAQETVFGPLGTETLHFPAMDPPFPIASYASTEKCPWRKRVLRGEVHDDNAWALDGVAGHAGLFGTASDVNRVLTALLEVYHGDRGFLCRETVHQFFSRPRSDQRALGFDVPDPEAPSCGRLFPNRALGHLGFTGTSFWMDPETALSVVLLTNRIHPSRENQKIREFRPKLHDAVMVAAG
jgi:CubicO group peptidase (beta-lactamase class C family)